MAFFTADGIYSQSDANGHDYAGAWAATGPATAVLTAVAHGLDASGAYAGSGRFHAQVTVAADGATFASTYRGTFLGPDGHTVKGRVGPSAGAGVRIVAQPTTNDAGTPIATPAP